MNILYTKKQTAEILKISISKLDRLRASRFIGYCKIGGSILFQQQHIDDLIAKSQIKAANFNRFR